METLNAAYITEQNKIASSGAWIWLMEISTTSLSTLRYTNDNAYTSPTDKSKLNITWPTTGGNKYWSLPFTLDDVDMSTSGKFPSYKVQIGDVSLTGALRTRIQANSGLVGSTMRLMVVHSAHLDVATAAIDELGEILSCDLTADMVTFTIGIPSLLTRRLPRDRYVPSFCRHRFAGALCQYVQPSYQRGTSDISFIAGVAGETGIQYNTIWINSGRLIADVFKNAPGHYKGANWSLDNDTGFTVSGSLYNDGFFLANSYHVVNEQYVRVFMEADKARPFVEEGAGELITIRLGYNGCDHTLEACQLRNNTQNFGGSPGIAGGIYG